MKQSSAAKAARRVSIDDRRRQVVPLLRARLQQQDIARQLNVDPATISRDVRAIRHLWQKECAAIMDTIVSEDVAILTDDERRWRTEMVRALQGRKVKVRDDTGNETDEWELPPNAELALKMYDRVLEIMDKRIVLLGKKPPTKIAPTSPDGKEPWSGLSEKELADRLLAVLNAGAK